MYRAGSTDSTAGTGDHWVGCQSRCAGRGRRSEVTLGQGRSQSRRCSRGFPRAAMFPRGSRGRVIRYYGRFQTVDRDLVLTFSELHSEEFVVALQDPEGTVVGWSERRLIAVPANEDERTTKQVVWDGGRNLGTVIRCRSGLQVRNSSAEVLKELSGRWRSTREVGELAREGERSAKNHFGGRGVDIILVGSADAQQHPRELVGPGCSSQSGDEEKP